MKNIALILLSFFILQSCGSIGNSVGALNLFPVSKDVELGKQTSAQLSSDKNTKIVPRSKAPEAYKLLEDIVAEIKNSGKLNNKDAFPWEVHIIDADVLNAFCAPGGYIYVYTGLMKYLDTSDDLAGVMGHEMAHADERHSTKQMTEQYGIEAISQFALGDKNNSQITQIGKSLVNLSFSRSDESQADTRSVEYLCNSKFKADGAATFFEKLTESGNSPSKIEEFFSTHPNPDNRVQKIREKSKGCNLNLAKNIDYKKIISRL